MAIYGIGAYYDGDVSQRFVENNLVGVGWSVTDAPELHEFIKSLKIGDIVYIKSYAPRATAITVKAIGIIINSKLLDEAMSNELVHAGRRVRWFSTEEFQLTPPTERNNVRRNTIYEEWHPDVLSEIMNRVIPNSIQNSG